MSNINTDGNLAALNAWQREQDALDAQDERDYQEALDGAEGMFDLYFQGDEEAIEELNDHIFGQHKEEYLLNLLRESFDPKPNSDGKNLQAAYKEFILEMCAGYHGVTL